jgi:cellulase
LKGVRVPAYNGAPGKGGYNNGPVKDLYSIDLRCNVMGDVQTSDTIKVVPGDSLTFDWCILQNCQHGQHLTFTSGIMTIATTQTTSSPKAIMVCLPLSTLKLNADKNIGPSLIYISPDPPTNTSFVKLWHSGKYVSNPFPQPGKWSTTSDIRKNFGHMNMRIPAGLKAGQCVCLFIFPAFSQYREMCVIRDT